MARSRKRPLWGRRFGKGPIERLFPRDHPREGEAAEREALAELDRRMALLAAYYGATSNKKLARLLAGELHPAFTIVDPKPPRATRMRGLAGLLLLRHVEVETEALRDAKTGKPPKREAVFAALQENLPRTYGKLSRGHLRKDYHAAKRHHQKSTKSRAKK